jgi:hypothetical protein
MLVMDFGKEEGMKDSKLKRENKDKSNRKQKAENPKTTRDIEREKKKDSMRKP